MIPFSATLRKSAITSRSIYVVVFRPNHHGHRYVSCRADGRSSIWWRPAPTGQAVGSSLATTAEPGDTVAGYCLRMPAVKMRVALAALLACALAGCHSARGDPATRGPLSSGTSQYGRIPRGANCLDRRGVPETFGDQQFTNYGHATVVLDRVLLLHPHNERLIGAYAIPGTEVVGVIPWPPKYPGMAQGWDHRQSVQGYRVAPGKTFNMVLGVTFAGPGFATSQGMLVYYHDAAGSYVAPNYFAMQIAATRSGKGCAGG